MRITPLDIQQQRFRSQWRGCDRAEVDAFLNLVASEVEALTRENHELREEVRRSKATLDQFREREQALKETMITAQRVTDDLKHAARKDAELIVGQAELEAEKILHNAHQRLVAVIDEINELKRQRTVLREGLRGLIQTHHKLLEIHEEDAAEVRPLEEKLKVLQKRPRAVEQEAQVTSDGSQDKRRGSA